MKTEYLLAHDLGTTGNKATMYAADGTLVSSDFYGYRHYIQDTIGWNRIRTTGGSVGYVCQRSDYCKGASYGIMKYRCRQF